MNWGSVGNFLAMGGDGFYVWMSYGACLAIVVGELLALRARRARARRAVATGTGE